MHAAQLRLELTDSLCVQSMQLAVVGREKSSDKSEGSLASHGINRSGRRVTQQGFPAQSSAA